MKRLVAAALALGGLTLASPARAFHPVSSFGRSANDGGGSGMYFSGSPRTRGYDCSVCHIEAPRQMRIEVDSDPPGLFGDGVYEPWQTYAITLRMVGEHRGLGTEGNENGMVVEVLDDQAHPVGDFAERELGTLQRVNGVVNVDGVIVGANQRDSWSFDYTAPGPDAGRLALYLAAVDGDAGATQAPGGPPSDPFGDDVFAHTWRFCEQWKACSTELEEQPEAVSPVGHGCSAGRGGPNAWLLLLGLALWIATRRRRDINR